MKQPQVRSPSDEAGAHDAAQMVVEVHRRLSGFLAHGQTLAQIDAFVGRTLADLGAKSCFYRYAPGRMPPFPSQACLSVNECVVHGTAGYTAAPLKGGDLLKIDVGVAYRGWIGDAAWTYSLGPPGPDAARLMKAGKDALRVGIAALGPRRPYMDWARAVHQCVEGTHGLHLVRGLGGHGYGRTLHAEPFISNNVPDPWESWPEGTRVPVPGELIAVEPMLAVGTGQTRQKAREWPIFSADGSLTAHYEHDVLITPEGSRVLTHGLEELEDVILR
jgi:methionyl aminopeptidase